MENNDAPYVVRWHDGDRYCIAVVLRHTPTRVHVLVIDEGLRRLELPRAEEAHMLPVILGLYPYPVKRALRVMRRVAKSHGATTRALRELRAFSAA